MSLSSRGRFSEEELRSLSVWDIPDLFNPDGTVNPELVEQVEAAAPVLTVEEIEAMQQQAYNEAFALGKQEGESQGYQEGYAKGLETGHQEGYATGMAEANEKSRQQLQAQGQQFTQLMEALNQPFKELDVEVERELVDLSIKIASQLVRRELKSDPGEIIAVVRAAVNALPVANQKITLQLHPLDAELVRSSMSLNDSVTSWNLVEDPLVTQGGCIVTTDVSYVDASVEKRLAQVISMVLGGERGQDALDGHNSQKSPVGD